MTGPAASVAIAGRADLAKETQDLTVRVVPVLGDSVAVAAGVALLNPIVGAGALIAQRLFKDPLGQMFSYEYQVTGSWEDPKVVRVRAPEPAMPGPGARDARAGERRRRQAQAQAVRAPFKVAAVQMVSEPSLAANLDAAGALVAEAAAKGAQLAVLPEWFCLMGRAERDKLAIRERGRRRADPVVPRRRGGEAPACG